VKKLSLALNGHRETVLGFEDEIGESRLTGGLVDEIDAPEGVCVGGIEFAGWVGRRAARR
jgi:hypothetical protein